MQKAYVNEADPVVIFKHIVFWCWSKWEVSDATTHFYKWRCQGTESQILPNPTE